MSADFEIEVPINVKGTGGKQAGNEIADAIAKKIKSITPKGGVIGRGGGLATEAAGDVASAAAKNAKGFEGIIGAIGKSGGIMAGVAIAVGAIALAVDAISEFLKPIFSLLKVIMLLLFLPLIPILKPVMKGLGEMAKRLAPIMIGLSKQIEKVLSPRIEKLVELIVNAVVSNIDSFVKVITGFLTIFEVFTPLLDVVLDGILKLQEFFIENGTVLFQVILDILLWAGKFLTDKWGFIKGIFDWIGTWLEPIWKIIKDALVEAGDFLQARWDNILNILERTADLLEGVFDKIKNVSGGFKNIGAKSAARFALPSLVGSFAEGGKVPETGLAMVHKGETVIPAGQGGGITININNPSVRNTSDIKQIANEVSRVLQRQMPGRFSSGV